MILQVPKYWVYQSAFAASKRTLHEITSKRTGMACYNSLSMIASDTFNAP